jgi:hypothetical protein
MATDIPVISPDTSSLIQPDFSISSRILFSLTEPGQFKQKKNHHLVVRFYCSFFLKKIVFSYSEI